MKKIVRLLRFLPALFILCCSWYLSSQETIEHMPGFWNADKLVHCICFAGFSFWIAFGFSAPVSGQPRLQRTLRILLPIICIALYAVIDEIHQSFTPGRECSVLDWCADVIGAAIGSFAYLFVSAWVMKWRLQRTGSE